MFFDLGLIATVAISGWIALDLLTSTGWRRRSLAVVALAASVGLWSAGDLLIERSSTPFELGLARRIDYLGICALPLSFLMLAAQSARPRWWRHARPVIAAAVLPSLLAYSCLFWDSQAWFVDWSVTPPRRGVLFWLNLLWSWSLIGLGWVYFVRTALRLRKASIPRMAMLAFGIAAPLVGNALYVLNGIDGPDPTPVLLGFGALLIRIAVVDSGLALYLPLARSDVMEQVEVGILVADLEGVVIDCNRAARALVGVQEAIGRPLAALLATASSREGASVEVRTLPLRSSVAEVGTAALLADRSEAQKVERRLALAARLEALGFLTAGIAHEVNNPLAFIRANLTQLEKSAAELCQPPAAAALPPRARELVKDAAELIADTQEGVERIANLVARLRRFARHERPDETPRTLVDLARVAEAAVAMAGAGLPPGAICKRLQPVPHVRAVEGDLVQIALNLLVNAVQASPDPAGIEIEVSPETSGVALRVRDRGTGIAPGVLPHIFDPFFTTKPPGVGTGLGLSLSYDLARRNGGRLDAANRRRGGAEFTLWLPAEGEASEAA